MKSAKKTQTGAELVEFSLVAALFFMALFLVVESARLMFSMNSLAEATRRGARIAAVCPVDHPAIQNITVFDQAAGGGSSPIVSGLDAGDVTVEYLAADGTLVPSPSTNPTDIIYVRVTINNFQHPFIVPFVATTLDLISFQTTLPAESLGAIPGQAPACFGV